MQRISIAHWDKFVMSEDLTLIASLISLLLNLYSKCYQRLILQILVLFSFSAKAELRDGNTGNQLNNSAVTHSSLKLSW